MTYLEIAKNILENKEIKFPLTAIEIWKQAIENGYTKDTIGKTPESSLAANLYVNVRDKKDSKFIKVGSRPVRFWLKARENEILGKENEIEAKTEELQKQEIKSKERAFFESDLHPLLVKFLNNNFNLYCKTINANTSINKIKGLNEWIHPDIVGIYFPFDDFDKSTLDLFQNLSKPSYKIYSFELKKFINNANLKECYFQAVSNSSWANEGYLVAFEIKDDNELQNELARLNASFGIGVIELKTLKVKFEAKNKELDIYTLDMLVQKIRILKNLLKI